MIHNEYSHQEENLRVVDTGKSKFKIVRDSGTGLWHIEVDTGSLPAALRDKRYTRHSLAFTEIKTYLDGHAERSVVYGRKKKTEEE